MVAGLDLAHHRGGDGRHARRGGAAGLRPLEGGHALPPASPPSDSEKAGVLEAGILVQEAGLALLGAVIDMALRQKQRLGGLAELRAHRAGMDEAGLRDEACPCSAIMRSFEAFMTTFGYHSQRVR